MSLSDIIKKIIEFFTPEIKFRADDSFKLSFLSNSKFIEVKKETVNNYYILNIDFTKATPEQEKKLTEILPEIKENGGLIIQKENYSDLAEYLAEGRDKTILKYFKGKISNQDYEALRIAVFIQKKSIEGKDITLYLNQLYQKFGSRGGNISNLYCEGYFESFIKPYYALLESQRRTDEFPKIFDDFVMNQPIAYFVNQYKTQEQVNKDLYEKIAKNKRYGVKRLNIHGIGESNIKKIKGFIKLIENNKDIKIIASTEQEGKIYVALEIV